MAERVAEWPKKYGIDGIDLDLEDGAGHRFKLLPFSMKRASRQIFLN